MNPKMEARNREIVRRRQDGESFASIARDLAMSEERVREIYNRDADPGSACVPPGATLSQDGSKWVCEGSGCRGTGRTAHIAVSRWHSARAHSERAAKHRAEVEARKAAKKAEAAAARARIAPPREPWRFEPIRLSQAFQAIAARARADQPRLFNMGSSVPEGGVL